MKRNRRIWVGFGVVNCDCSTESFVRVLFIGEEEEEEVV